MGSLANGGTRPWTDGESIAELASISAELVELVDLAVFASSDRSPDLEWVRAWIAERRARLVELRATLDGLAPDAQTGAEEATVDEAASPSGSLAFFPAHGRYAIGEWRGEEPRPGATVALAEDGEYTVLRVGASPLPEDRRRCLFLERAR